MLGRIQPIARPPTVPVSSPRPVAAAVPRPQANQSIDSTVPDAAATMLARSRREALAQRRALKRKEIELEEQKRQLELTVINATVSLKRVEYNLSMNSHERSAFLKSASRLQVGFNNNFEVFDVSMSPQSKSARETPAEIKEIFNQVYALRHGSCAGQRAGTTQASAERGPPSEPEPHKVDKPPPPPPTSATERVSRAAILRARALLQVAVRSSA